VQDYHNWELLIVGDHCPVLDAYMEQQKQAVLGGWTGRREGHGVAAAAAAAEVRQQSCYCCYCCC
jgi:hypothetical protein